MAAVVERALAGHAAGHGDQTVLTMKAAGSGPASVFAGGGLRAHARWTADASAGRPSPQCANVHAWKRTDWKGKISPALYLSAIPLAFVNPWIANGIFVLVAALWLIPDRRIERVLVNRKESAPVSRLTG